MWVEGVPADHGRDADRPQAVHAVTLHRTIGTWPGDYSVGKNRLHSTPGTFNFLIGQDEGQWVQFYSSDTRCSHAAGSNTAGPGIEFSGQNGEPLTDWQIRAGRHVIGALAFFHGLPLVLHDEPRIQVDGSSFRGFVNHRGVATSPQYQHFDYVTQDEFARMAAPPVAAGSSGGTEAMIYAALNVDGSWTCRLFQGTHLVREFPREPRGHVNLPQPALDWANADPQARVPIRQISWAEMDSLTAAESGWFLRLVAFIKALFPKRSAGKAA